MVLVCIFALNENKNQYFIVVVSVAPYDQVQTVHRYISFLFHKLRLVRYLNSATILNARSF